MFGLMPGWAWLTLAWVVISITVSLALSRWFRAQSDSEP